MYVCIQLKFKNNLKFIKMNENLKKIGITFVVVVAALGFYQVVVAPRLVKKPTVATK